MGNMLSRKKTKWNVWSQREKHTNTTKESQSWKYGARTSVMHTINCINYSWIITSNIVFMYVLCIYAWKKNEKAFFPLLFTILQFPIVYAIQYIFAPSTFYYFVWRFTSLFLLLAHTNHCPIYNAQDTVNMLMSKKFDSINNLHDLLSFR